MELADQERWAAEQELQSPRGFSYKDLVEDSNASFTSDSPQIQRAHSNFSAVSRATSVASSLISRTHSTFLQGHKKFGLKRKSLWEKAQARDLSFCVFARTNLIRRFAIRTIENPWFNRLVLSIVLANCVFLAIANPNCDTEVEIKQNAECQNNPKWQRIIVANYLFTAAFSVEILLQSIAKNFIIGPNAYLKNGWSWLDFITTLTSYSPYLPGNAINVSSLRAFRALRPLRTISAYPGIRLLVSTLIAAIPLLLDVVLLLAWVFFVFGIMGLQLFMGRLLGRCHPLDPVTLQPQAVPEELTDQVCSAKHDAGTYSCGEGYVCLTGNYEAAYGNVSFDNIGRALLQVLQVVSLESWSTTQMYYMLDGVGSVVVIYYLCLIVIGTYFALNLLVAVISAKFAQLHVDNQKDILARDRAAPNITANAWFYFEFLVSMLLKREDLVPWAEQSRMRRLARRLVEDNWFQRFVMTIVFVNIVVMAMYHADMSYGFAKGLETINLVLTILFTIEMVIKHVALGLLGYWSNGFNVLDGLIVIASLVDLGLEYSGKSHSHGGGGVSSLRVLRLLRVFRSLKLLRQIEGLNKIVNIVLKSMVALKDFMLLLILFIFIFMVLGIQLFGGSTYYTPANTASWRKGFSSFYESFYTLFEALTGESWTGNIWNSMSAVGPASCLFWIAWDIVGHKILLNLFLAILINNFQDQEEGMEDDEMDVDSLSPHSPANNQVVPFGGRGGDMMWGNPYRSSRAGTLEGYQLDPRHMLSPPALGSSRRVGGANGDAPGSRRSSQEALWGRLSSQEAVGSNSRQSVLGRLTTLAGSRRNLGPPERRSSTDNLGLPSTRAPTLGAAGRKGSFFIPEVPRQSGTREFEHVHNFTRLVRGQAPQPGAYHNVLRMRRWLVSLDSNYGVKDWQVVRTQMDQEAEIMKQSMARQEAAQAAAAEETEKEEDSAEPLRTVSSGARGLFATFSKKRFMLPVPFSPFRRHSGVGFDPEAHAAAGPRQSPPGSPPSGANPQNDDAPRLEPPEPPQLVLPSLSKRLSSIVKQEGRVLSRLHLAKGPEAPKDAQTDAVTADDLQAAAKLVEMTDLEAGKQAAESQDKQEEGQQCPSMREGGHADGGKHVHIADASAEGASQHGGKHSSEADRKVKLWDDMLKRKVDADLEKQKNNATLDSAHATPQDEEERMSRINSKAALLGSMAQSSDGVSETLTPSILSVHQLPPLEQPRFLSKQGLMGALHSSRRFLPALLKKSDGDPSQIPGSSSAAHPGGGTLGTMLETAGSVDSNAPLLPGGMPSDQSYAVGLAGAMQPAGSAIGADGQTVVDMNPVQDTSLEVAGFAGAVAEAYASYNYVSLGILTEHNPLRRFCMQVITNMYFEGFVLLLVLLSSVTLALDTPSLDDSSRLGKTIGVCNMIFVVCFALEMCLKIVALGFIAHPGAYLRSPWNQLDFVVVITSIISTASPTNHVAILKALRLLRVLRPLRMISRFKGMQIVVLALIRSIPPISSVAMFGLFEFIIFAIIGIQLFSGRLGACNQVEIDGVAVQYRNQCIEGVTFVCNGAQDNNCNDGEATVRQWQIAFYNFDNFASSLLSVVEVAVMDNYMDDVAYFVMDATGVDKQPQLWHNPWAGLYVVAVCFFLGLFWVNLLQGAIIDNYCRLIEEMGTGALLTEEQKKWLDVLRLKGTARQGQKDNSLLPSNPVRRVCFQVVTHQWFDPAILGLIILNMILICMGYRGQSQKYSNVLSGLNICFVVAYTAEALLKNAAVGPWKYIKDNWNKLDLAIVILALVDIFTTSNKVSSLSSVFRIFRVVRLAKVLQQVKGLRTLFNTLLSSLPAVFNVGSLLFLMFFIYAILGMNLFGTPGSELSQSDPHANFLSFPASMLTLFRLSTSDSWDQILQESQGCPIFNVACDSGGKGVISAIYCISFIFGVNFVMLNLVIAVIIDQFVESAGREGLFLDNTLFEILHKKMLLDRFLKRLRTKVRNYQESQQAATKKAKRGRRKSILLFGGKQPKVGFDSTPEGPPEKPVREPSLGRGLESAFLANLFRTPSNSGDNQAGLILSRGGSAVEPASLIRGRSTTTPAISRSATQNPQNLEDRLSPENSKLS